MIYIAKQASKQAPATVGFTSMGLSNLTQTRLGDVTLIAKPRHVQVAHSGYKNSIEAFLYAAAVEKKVYTSQEHFPIPDSTKIILPLPYPRIVFRLAKKPAPAMLAKMEERLSPMGLNKVNVGRDGLTYTLDSPDMNTLLNILPSICTPTSAFMEQRCQLEAAIEAVRIHQCVDLFLRVNTYEYKHEEQEGVEEHFKDSEYYKYAELRFDDYVDRDGYTDENAESSSKRMKIEGKEVARKIDDMETEDITPHKATMTGFNHTVLIAKPSPKKSKDNWGLPSEVPFKDGILFPYFRGLLMADANEFRVLTSSLFFRNLGQPGHSLKEAYLHFRKVLGTYANSPEGLAMSHILIGCRLALDAQALLYLLFDGVEYLGFCLLGSDFDIQMGGQWYSPLTAEALRDELMTINTARASFELLIEKLKITDSIDGGKIGLPEDGVKGPVDLARMLAKVKIGEDNKESVEELEKMLSRTRLSTSFLGFSPKHIETAIDILLSDDLEVPRQANVYIPPTGWSKIGTKEYLVFSSFGPRSFSFRNAKGKEYAIPCDDKERDPYESKEEDGKTQIIPYFLVGEKPINTCIEEWRQFVETGKMRMDFVERAAGQRNHKFLREHFDGVWKTLVRYGKGGKLRVKEKGKAKEVVTRARDFGKGSFEDVFGDDVDLDRMFG